jgi:hypothetical protein
MPAPDNNTMMALPTDWEKYQFMIGSRTIQIAHATKEELIHGLVDAMNALEDFDDSLTVMTSLMEKWRTGR